MSSLAFVFPGQGSQALKMLSALSDQYSLVKEIFQRASTQLGYDLWQLTQAGPEEKLNQTEFTQPALLTASVAVWNCWIKESSCRPKFMAGHSLGEYSALVCAEALSLEDAAKLVAYRGRYMQEAVPAQTGGMAAIIGLDRAVVTEVCKEAAQESIVTPANLNSPEQIVIGGHIEAVKRAIDLAKQKGAKLAVLLPMSVPSHCSLMEPAAKKLAEKLQQVEIRMPKISVIHNYNVQTAHSTEEIRHNLIAQLTQPVRWVETVESLAKQGVSLALECGPGRVLAGLNKRIISSLTTLPLSEPDHFTAANRKIEETKICL